jgi:hypothetical protein
MSVNAASEKSLKNENQQTTPKYHVPNQCK